MARSNNGTSTNYFEASGGLPIPNRILANTALTISCWFKSANAAATSNLSFYIDSGGVYFGITADGANVDGFGAGRIVVDTGTNSAGTSTAISDTTTWHHCVGSRDTGSNLSVYLDGGGKGTYAFAANAALGNNLTIGAFSVFSGGVFSPMNGAIAEVAWWNAQLTDAEVLSLSKGVPAALIRPDKLINYFPLREDTGVPQDLTAPVLPMTQNGTMAAAAHPPVFGFNSVDFEPQGAAAALSASLVVSPMQTLLNQLLAR